MTTHIAFLRAINVGGRRVQMDHLKALFEELGLSEVSTFLASGNVAFSADDEPSKLETDIAAHLEDRLGYDVPVFVRTLAELDQIAQSPIFAAEAAEANNKRYVAFLKKSLDQAQRRTIEELSGKIDELAADGRQLYWLRHVDAGESMPTGEVEKTLGCEATRRTFRTVERLVAKFGG